MQFTSIVLLLLSATNGLMAFSTAEPNSSYVELWRESTSKGHLIYLGPPEESKMVRKEEPKLEERAICTQPQSITCSAKDNEARNNVCDQLVTELFGDPTISVGAKPRQVCFLGETESNSYCCVSWNKAVPNLIKGDLANPANKIMAQCTTNGISGKMDNVGLERVCATLCLSNRGTGCD